MLLGCTLGEGLEPVSIVGYAILNSPLLDTSGNSIGYRTVETCSIVDYVNELLINILREILLHLLTVEDILTELLIGAFLRCLYGEGALLECLLYNLKS